MRSLLIIALSAALAFTCHRLAEIENQRYALLLGMSSAGFSNPLRF